ncbi:MAG: DUF4123 domain-containing protein [Planctomycetes bacterium]|nr:DUF4123 domain-containing protein [Planctomycetota bacterium]
MTEQVRQLGSALRKLAAPAPGELLYAVVDGAREGMGPLRGVDLRREQLRSLFEGEMAPYLGDVAPYLVSIDPAGGCLDDWARTWGRSVGILLIAETDFDALWRHLRGLFIAEDEDGQRFFFRYYDPRVLRSYLPTCTADEAGEFFGPIERILVEAEGPDKAIVCSACGDGVKMEEVQLEAFDQASRFGGGDS